MGSHYHHRSSIQQGLKYTCHEVGESAWNGILGAHSSLGEGLKRATVSLNVLSNSVVDRLKKKKAIKNKRCQDELAQGVKTER